MIDFCSSAKWGCQVQQSLSVQKEVATETQKPNMNSQYSETQNFSGVLERASLGGSVG